MTIEEYLGKDNDIGIAIWKRKYQFEDESFEEFTDRITNKNEDIKKLFLEKKFIYAGRILANRGLQDHGIKVTYSNCYVVTPPKDSLESIFETMGNLGKTYAYGGGCGADMSLLRPNGAKVHNAARSSSGVVSFMELFAHTTATIAQNGRRGALMLSLDCNHPDLEEFIMAKEDLKKIVDANISVKIDDEFMNKVVNDLPHTLRFETVATKEVIEKTVSAKQMFGRLAKMNWRTAEPGILYWDSIKHWNLLSETEDFEFAGVNPCAEEPLPAGGSCLLSSINLSEFVKYPFTPNAQFDYEGFQAAVDVVVREMNIILEEGLELHPLQEQKDSVTKWRQIGLGFLGLADALIKLGIIYGSYPSIVISERIGKSMIQQAMKTSALLAKEFGAYPGCDIASIMKTDFYKANKNKELDELVSQYGLRNSQLLTVAPTGSISTMLGVSGGVEPIFATKYIRTTKSLEGNDIQFPIYTPIIKQYMDMTNTTEDNLPGHIVTSMNLDWKRRIKMQSTWQKYIDAAISSTINLPQETTVQEVFDIYVEAWKAGIKGVTIYRSGCEREGILNIEQDDEEMHVTNDDHNCPECNAELIAVDGCFTCPNCGWGKCSV